MSINSPHPMNKEDSKEGPVVIEGFVDNRNLKNRFGKEHYYGVYLWPTDTDANEERTYPHTPATLVIGSKAIPEGEVVKLREHIQQARELLRRAKIGTRFARQYEAMAENDKPATTGIEFDKDVDAFLLSTSTL